MRGRTVRLCFTAFSLLSAGAICVAAEPPGPPSGFRPRSLDELFSETLPDLRNVVRAAQFPATRTGNVTFLPSRNSSARQASPPAPRLAQERQRVRNAAFSVNDSLRFADGTGAPTIEQLAAELIRVQALTSLSARDKQQIIKSYETAIEQLKSKQQIEESTSRIVEDYNRIDAEIADASQTLETYRPSIQDSAPLTDNAVSLKSEIDSLRDQLEQQESLLRETAEDLTETQEQNKQLEETIAQTVELQAALADADTSSAQEAISRAAQIENRVTSELLNQKIEQYELRLRKNEKAVELRKLQQQLAFRSIPVLELAISTREKQIDASTSAVLAEDESTNDASSAFAEMERSSVVAPTEAATAETGRARAEALAARHTSARAAVAQAERIGSSIHPVLQRHAERNAALATRNVEVVEMTRRANQDSESIAQTFETSVASFERVTQRLDEDGLTRTVGLLLRKDRVHLPEVRPTQKKLQAAQTALRAAGDEEMLLEEESHHFAEWSESLIAAVAALEGRLPSEDLQTVEADAKALIADRRMLLHETIRSLGEYEESLGEFGANCTHLLKHREHYAALIDEHTLWVRSHQTFGFRDLAAIPNALGAAVRPTEWSNAFEAFRTSFTKNLAVVGLTACWFLLLNMFGGELRDRLQHLGRVARESHDLRGLLATVEASLHTLLLSSARPVLLFAIGWLFNATWVATDFAVTLGDAFMVAAPLLAALEFARQICSRNGLGEAHCGWNPDSSSEFASTSNG